MAVDGFDAGTLFFFFLHPAAPPILFSGFVDDGSFVRFVSLCVRRRGETYITPVRSLVYLLRAVFRGGRTYSRLCGEGARKTWAPCFANSHGRENDGDLSYASNPLVECYIHMYVEETCSFSRLSRGRSGKTPLSGVCSRHLLSDHLIAPLDLYVQR